MVLTMIVVFLKCWFGCLLERLFPAPVWAGLNVGWFCWLAVGLHGSTFGSTGCLVAGGIVPAPQYIVKSLGTGRQG